MEPAFADLRTITGGAESIESGHDPMIENPGDPWNRPLNYPRIWQSLYRFGINQGHTVWMGYFIILFFIIGIILFFRQRSIFSINSIMLLFAVFSPAVMLTVERGNIDMLMFFLISLSIFLISKEGKFKNVSAFLALVFAFILKLYPIFAISVFLRESKRKFVRYFLAIFIIAIIYTIISYSDLIYIFQNTPKDAYLSYGINVLWTFLYHQSDTLGILTKMFSYVIFLLILLYSFMKYLKKGHLLDYKDSKTMDGFRAGAMIYIATFLLGNNFDYRLLFLLFTLPQLFVFVKSKDKIISIISLATVLSIFISLWHLVIADVLWGIGLQHKYSIAIDEIANWVVFLGLIYLFVMSLPDWFMFRKQHKG